MIMNSKTTKLGFSILAAFIIASSALATPKKSRYLPWRNIIYYHNASAGTYHRAPFEYGASDGGQPDGTVTSPVSHNANGG
jgi:hypothetical protein